MTILPKLKKKRHIAKDGVLYEMILEWSSERKPFCLQKLNFKAGKSFKSAYNEALEIKKLLQSAGDYKAKDVRLLAVGRAGVLRAHDIEHGILARPHLKAIAQLVKKAKNFNLGKPTKPTKPTSGTIDPVILTIRK